MFPANAPDLLQYLRSVGLLLQGLLQETVLNIESVGRHTVLIHRNNGEPTISIFFREDDLVIDGIGNATMALLEKRIRTSKD